MKRIISGLLSMMMFVSCFNICVYAANKTYIYNLSSPYLELVGSWGMGSSLLGLDDSETTYATGGGGAKNYAIVRPNLVQGGKYKVSFWNTVYPTNCDMINIDVYGRDKIVNSSFFIHNDGEAGLVTVGEFDLAPGTENYIKLYNDGGSFRVNCIVLELLEAYDSITDIDVPGNDYVPEKVVYPQVELKEIEADIPEAHEESLQLYVDCNSTSNGDGSIEAPFNDILAARDYVRNIIANGMPDNGITVNLREGTYQLTETFLLGNLDSGNENAPVIWQAYDNENVTFTAGKVIDETGAKFAKDTEYKDQIPYESKEFIKVVDLRENGVSSIPEITMDNGVSAKLIFGSQDGVIARYPNEGYAKTGNLIDYSSRYDEGPRKKGFVYEIDDPRQLRWENSPNLWVNGFWKTDYTYTNHKVAQMDTYNMSFSSIGQDVWGAFSGARYYAYNTLSELDSPGEWYADEDNMKLFYYPYDEESYDELIFVDGDFTVASISGGQYIYFKGINITAGGNNGMSMTNCNSCGIIGGEIYNVSGTGVTINGSANSFLRDNEIYNCDSGFQIAGGDTEKYVKANNYAENVSVHDIASAGGSLAGCGNRVSHCHIYNIQMQGLTGSGCGQIYEYNTIERTSLNIDDTGAIYFNAGGGGFGSIFRYNKIIDSVGLKGAVGIYIDDVTSGVKIYGNIVANMNHGIHIHGGRMNSVEDNILINVSVAVLANTVSSLKNISEGGATYNNVKKLDLEAYAAAVGNEYEDGANRILNIFSDEFGYPKHNIITDNIFVNSGESLWSDAERYGGTIKDNVILSSLPEGVDGTSYHISDWSGIKAAKSNFPEFDTYLMGTYHGGMNEKTGALVYNNSAQSFNITYPANGAVDCEAEGKLKWEVTGGIEKAKVVIAADPEFTNVVEYEEISSTEYDYMLEYGKTYYWRVEQTPLLGYDSRWNENGVFSFTTISLEDKLIGEILKLKSLMLNSDEGNRNGQVKFGTHKMIADAVNEATIAYETGTQNEKLDALDVLAEAQAEFYESINASSDNLTTVYCETYSNDKVGDKPLNLFSRNGSVINTFVSEEPGNALNHVVKFDGASGQVQTQSLTFRHQENYMEAASSVMPAQSNATFGMQVRKTGSASLASATQQVAAVVYFMSDGKLYADIAKEYYLCDYVPNKWYNIKMSLDVAEQKYDVYVNGDKLAENVPFTTKGVTSVSHLRYVTSDGTSQAVQNQGVFYADNTIVRIPESKGSNPYLKGIKFNGIPLEGFTVDKQFYQVDMTPEELESAELTCELYENAASYEYYDNGKKIVAICSGDNKSTAVYIFRSKN